ncbi:MAG: ribonuclease R [Clostridiales bacterium]|jgi:ribonuclease R|nr:ribonuclease R [Clostridiales bacterium]
MEVKQEDKLKKVKNRIIIGTYEGTSREFAFVKPEDPSLESIFVYKSCSRYAFHRDRVKCQVLEEHVGSSHAQGVILEVLEPEDKEMVCTYSKIGGVCCLVPSDIRHNGVIFLTKKQAKQLRASGLEKSDKALFSISRANPPAVRLKSILGKAGEPNAEVMSLVLTSGISYEFDENVIGESLEIPETVDCAQAAARPRVQGQAVTIDGEDTKDVDDAVTLRINEKGNFLLGVHIADVANYVAEGSSLDSEAAKRGVSVYLADRVIPMLPARLSNGICSLNEGVDRLALSCWMEIDRQGEVVDKRIEETVLRVDKRMNYKAVTAALEGKSVGYEEFIPMLSRMKELCLILAKKRVERGAIFFDMPEAKIIVGEDGEAVDVLVEDRTIAAMMIEEFMLVCNETVAKTFQSLGAPFVYRVHEKPDNEKITRLKQVISYFGYKLKGGEDLPDAIQGLLNKSNETPEASIIARLTLRSFKQAKYSPVNDGHFGLAADYYCHFTSPIRRYPDLQIHRIIKEHIHGMSSERKIDLKSRMAFVSESCSRTERVAEELEREVAKLKKASYMVKFIGREFTGVITGITKFGIFIELPNTVEGMAPIRDMADHFEYIESSCQLRGEYTKKVYTLGDIVRVMVEDVKPVMREINFRILEKPKESRSNSRISKGGAKKRRRNFKESV